MSKLREIRNQKGFITTEAAVLLPMMLVGLCIVLAFMYVFYKWGAAQLIFNHMELSSHLGTEPSYSLLWLEDDRTEVVYSAEQENYGGEVQRFKQAASLAINPPFLEKKQVLQLEETHYQLSFQREIQLCQGLIHAAKR